MEAVETAENLYIYKNKTYEEISQIITVPVVTIQRWSEKYEWRKAKLDYIKRRVGRRKELYTIKDNLIKEAKDNTDPQAVYKLGALQKTIDAEEKGDTDESMQKIDRPQMFLDFFKDLVSYLKEHDPDALSALEKNFDPFIDWAKQKYGNQ
jgi:transposase